ncbi:hypothetical protein B0H34DRAFT_775563, partial [Crassisporium funariophilum]
MMVARKSQKITKYNLLTHYANTHSKAFTASTIQASFQKTGIWPVDHTVIEDLAFGPAANTLTQSAQPVPARLSLLLKPIDWPCHQIQPWVTSPLVLIHPHPLLLDPVRLRACLALPVQLLQS